MHPLKHKALDSRKEKYADITKEQPKGHDIRASYKEENHTEIDRLREAQSLPVERGQRMPKAEARAKYGEV